MHIIDKTMTAAIIHSTQHKTSSTHGLPNITLQTMPTPEHVHGISPPFFVCRTGVQAVPANPRRRRERRNGSYPM